MPSRIRCAVWIAPVALAAACLAPPPPLPEDETDTAGMPTGDTLGGSGSGSDESGNGDSGSTGMGLDTSGSDSGEPTSMAVDMQGRTCLGVGDTLTDFVDDQGMALTCGVDTGEGNGLMPEGVSLEDCELSGYPSEPHNGAWAFMVWVLRDDGAEAVVPFCAGKTDSPGWYHVFVDHGGLVDVEDKAALYTYEAGGELHYPFGSLLIEVSDPTECAGMVCEHGVVATQVEASPFGPVESAPAVVESNVLDDGVVWDFGHAGPIVPAAFEQRPFVATYHLKLCLENTAGLCAQPSDIETNGRDALQVSVVAIPSGWGQGD